MRRLPDGVWKIKLVKIKKIDTPGLEAWRMCWPNKKRVGLQNKESVTSASVPQWDVIEAEGYRDSMMKPKSCPGEVSPTLCVWLRSSLVWVETRSIAVCLRTSTISAQQNRLFAHLFLYVFYLLGKRIMLL